MTGLRGAAATMVMLDHYGALDFSYPFPAYLLPHMYLAVDMFMLLSGFILAMVYEPLLAAPAGQAARTFLYRRIARLYPVYALMTVVCFVLCRAGLLTFLDPDSSLPALAANLAAVQTWAWPGSSLDGPAWSVSTEWLVNLAFPLLLPVVLGRSAGLSRAVHAMAWTVLGLTAVFYGQLFDIPSPGAVNVISGPGAVGRCASEFVIGMTLWRLRSRSHWAQRLSGRGPQVALLLAMALLIQFTQLDVPFVAACALLLVGLSFERSAPSAVLRSAPLLFLGRISYSLYLLHIALLPLRDALAPWLQQLGVPAAWGCAVLGCAGVTVVLAALSQRFVEQPCQRWLLQVGRQAPA